MDPKIKNIIIIGAAAVLLVGGYVFYASRSAPQPDLVTNAPSGVATLPASSSTSGVVGSDFLTLLLDVKNIKLDDSIFSDPAFTSLHDSSIVLTPDTDTGRVNPFAPIGVDSTSSVTNSPSSTPASTPFTPLVTPGSNITH